MVRVLDRIAANRGYPVMLRMDNGPEFISLALAEWAEQHAVKLEFIQPGKPANKVSRDIFLRTSFIAIKIKLHFSTKGNRKYTGDYTHKDSMELAGMPFCCSFLLNICIALPGGLPGFQAGEQCTASLQNARSA